MKYLDPKANPAFKKVFGEHPDLVTSLLNALLPFESPEEYITKVEYLPTQMVSQTTQKKNSIVDVRCKDKKGRVFIVELQMLWPPVSMQRVLLNTSKTYVRQAGRSKKHEPLQPVYSLSLANGFFLPDLKEYYHDYRIVQMEHTDQVIEGLRFIFVELPKFTPQTSNPKKMHVLWLRFLTEIDEKTRQVPQELMDNPETRKALAQLEKPIVSDVQLPRDDNFWNAVMMEEELVSDAVKEDMLKGMKKGMAKRRTETARRMKADGMPMEIITKYMRLSTEDIEKA